MSSPNMNNMIMIGCLLTYLSVILLGTDGGLVRQQHYPAMCSVSTQSPTLHNKDSDIRDFLNSTFFYLISSITLFRPN